MKKTDWQYLVDTLLFLCIVSITIIGFLMGLVIPKGPASLESTKYFLGLHRHQWGNIHFYLSIAFVILVIIHLTLSWKWVKNKSRQLFKKGWRAVLVLTATASLATLILFWSLYPKVPGAYEDHGVRIGERAREQQLSKEDYSIFEEKSGIHEKLAEKESEHEQKLTRGISAEDQSGILITGQMTLYDLEKETGIPARKITYKLGLPSNVPRDETLGRLRRRYGFIIQDVRDAIVSLMEK